MYNPNFLTLSRHHVYYFRFPIPQRLHPQGKRTDIKLSLDTRCPREALQLARVLGYAGEQILHHTEVNGMDYQTIRDVLHEHFKAMLERHKQRLATRGRLLPMDTTALQNSRAFAVDALKTRDYTIMGNDAHMTHFIDAYALPVNRDSTDYNTLRTEFLKAYRDYCTAAIEQDAQLDGFDFNSLPITSGTLAKANHKKLAEMITEYCAENVRLHHWREKTAKSHRSKFDVLLRFLGQDVRVNISDEVANEVKNMLLLLPKNAKKIAALKNLTIKELMALKLSPEKKLSPPTVAGYLSVYSAFYDWRVIKKAKVENNFSHLIDDVSNTRIDKEPFTLEQTNVIMAELLKAKKPHMKWGMMIAFYTGARVNEIAQLYVDDFVEVDGVKCFRLTNEKEDQRLKNKSSKRTIPIHSRLIELGLLEYVNKVGSGRIFPTLPFDESNGYGRRISVWVNESLLPRLGIKKPELTFHSTRHTLAQQLRNNKIPESTIREIIGHAQSGSTFVVYANNLDKRVVQEALETVKYL